MESQKPKIAMYVERSFGDKLTAAFNFFNENWKVLLKYSAYFLLPVCIVQALSLNQFMGSYMSIFASAGSDVFESFDASFWISYGLMIIFSAVGGLLMYSLIYALIKIYNEREERLVGLTFSELKPVLFCCMRRLFIIGVFMWGVSILVIGVVTLLAVMSLYTLLLTLPILFACLVPLLLFVPIYLFEKIDLWQAFMKTFRLGFATWGGIVGISFVMGFIANILYGVASIPWYVLCLVGVLLSASGVQDAATSSAGYSVVAYLFGIIMLYGIYVSMIFPMLGLAYQYGHACEKMENISVVDDIDKFEQL